jgi:hypothetical protein
MGGMHETVGRVGLAPNGFSSTTTLRRREGGGRRHDREGAPRKQAEDCVTIGAEEADEDAPAMVTPGAGHPSVLPSPAWDRARRF